MNSKDCRKLAALELAALQIGDHTACNANDVIRIRTEVVIPRSGSSPHFVILQQIWINKHTQLSAVAEGRDATVGL